LYNDARNIILNARKVFHDADNYIDYINKNIILDSLREVHRPREKPKTSNEKFRESVTDIFLYILQPQRLVNSSEERKQAKIVTINNFEENIQTSSMIIALLSHRERLRFFKGALQEDLEAVNKRWLDYITARYDPFERAKRLFEF
jgi:hypothetical protein